ncbi:hypothetical protein NEOLEDRAFT_792953 [Neolentinus lepideus HHB14362 ss-1]|uniref:RING-type E3 ubiquitin transferase n=1 Tax=Neolentinus lepideus HHB14362 ss-1 TaxID=1314782 RepID=A0A165PL36_9AGAM|nr:hypothetical protein NEOLEDRAFT_792953 [Neolentinus lepideus HHB14362 ss-1]
MQEEQDTCRICSAPAEPDQPLFHPCKCSGTIRYIHQDCLTTWLTHSKKKTCDVCKYPYSFEKVYALDMPNRLPPLLLLRRLAQQCFWGALFCVRAVVVGIVWLAILPWVTLWTWRMYFAMGDSTAWYISDRPRPPSSYSVSMFDRLIPASRNETRSVNGTAMTDFLSHPTWRNLSADIFTGQIIACLIVLVFVAVFLLREWIVQNARPGVLEEEDVQGQAPEAPVQPAEPPLPALEPIPAPEPRDQVRRPLRDNRQPRRLFTEDSNSDSYDDDDILDERPESGKRRHQGETSGVDRAPGRARMRVRRRRRPIPTDAFDDDRSDEETNGRPRRSFRHPHPERLYTSGLHNKAPKAGPSHPDTGPDGSFTFSMPLDTAASIPRSESDPSLEQAGVRSFVLNRNVPPDLINELEAARATASHPVPPESDEVPFWHANANWMLDPDGSPPQHPESETAQDPMEGVQSFPDFPEQCAPGAQADADKPESSSTTSSDSWTEVTASAALAPEPFTFAAPDPSAAERMFASNPPTPLPYPLTSSPGAGPSTPRRPPLPSITLSPAGGSSTSSLLLPQSQRGTPLLSPSLATYGAPEEFGQGPSPLASGYFDAKTPNDEEAIVEEDVVEEEHDHYFRLPEDVPGEAGEREEHEPDATPPPSNVGSDDEEVDGGLVRVDMMEVDARDEPEPEGREPVREEEAPLQPQPAGALGLDLNDMPDGDVQDDMDGAMEAIGMRGPIYGVLQNAALMIFILDTTIGLGIWIPFTIGKSTALLCMDPRRLLHILHSPIRAMRLITDPVVDLTLYILIRWIVSPVLSIVKGNEVLHYGSSMFTGQSESADMTATSNSTVVEVVYGAINQVLESDSAIVRAAEPYFAVFGERIRETAAKSQDTWVRLAMGDGIPERIFAVALGYVVIGIYYTLYLNVLSSGSAQSAGRAIRGIVRQQLLIVKMASFITIELAIFPLGCGLVLDLCTIWLFPESTLQTRAMFFRSAPITAIFYHWVVGTMFMYQFAVLLAGCRGIMRPGAMWFIKDPQDQNYHPIRDILERPSLTQLRKLLVSAVMYAIVIAFGVATMSALILSLRKSTLPLRWRIRQPLSNVPLDLLFLHVWLPYTMDYFRPNKALGKAATAAWRYAAGKLRLTSYMFGERVSSEEFTPAQWFGLQGLTKMEVVDEGVRDGHFRRVPADDNIALPREMRATAEVDESGTPVNDEAASLIQVQNAEAEKAKRNPKTDYTIVYVPPNFRIRILTFILMVWLAICAALAAVLVVPIQLGRLFFSAFISREVHDGYSFLAGIYLLWACYLAGYAADRLDKRRQRRGGDEPRAEWPLYLAKRMLLWLSKITYMIITLGVIIPVLIALVVEFYLILPFRYTLDVAYVPRIHLVDMWALGLVYGKIAIHAQRVQPADNRFLAGFANITRNGWTHPDPMRATKEVIAPLAGGLLAALLSPIGIDWLCRRLLALPLDNRFLFMHVYPGIFAAAGLYRLIEKGWGVLSAWSQIVRDKEFLVEMRLQNLESDSPARSPIQATPPDTPGTPIE